MDFDKDDWAATRARMIARGVDVDGVMKRAIDTARQPQPAPQPTEPPKRAKAHFTVGRRKADGWSSAREKWEE